MVGMPREFAGTGQVIHWDRSSELLGPRASRPHAWLRSRSQVSFKSDTLLFNEGGRDSRGPSNSLDRSWQPLGRTRWA